MLKLPKGLKKKKKGKKSKKDQELFTEEELEQYKLQQQLKQQQQQQQQQEPPVDHQEVSEQAGETSASDTESAKPGPSAAEPQKLEGDEEWQKFKALTAGIDSFLHKTQDDLDRIKSTSFFQRVPPPSEKKKKEEEEAARREAERLEAERRKKEEEEANRDVLAEAVVELSESEEESEEVDDIFDTGYIEAITSGEVQFAVVPDSPDLPFDDGPDPFDTSYADKLIKGPEVSKRGKKLVSIGAAVEVLTGRVESAQPASAIRRRPRRGPQDLLLEAFDDGTESPASGDAEISVTPESPKTLLDELEDDVPAELPPIDLSVSLHLTLQKQAEENKATEVENVDVLSEFDVLKADEDDEFAELAAESLTKREEVTVLTQAQPLEYTGEVAGDWAEFESQPEPITEEKTAKGKPPRPPPVSGPGATAQPDSDDEFSIPDDDPFDTTFVEKVIPVKDDDDDFDFDPRADEKQETEALKVDRDLLGGSSNDLTNIPSVNASLSVARKDLLGGSTTDLSAIGPAPIDPLQNTLEDRDDADFDPFDTSAVSGLVQPKETELKFLEKELLEESKLKHSLSDPDFDPRAGDEEVSPTAQQNTLDQIEQARRKSSLHLNIQSKTVGFLVPDADLLATDNDHGRIHKPLTPYYTKEAAIIDTEISEPIDPFDTSFVADSKPTQVEINLLEKDLLASTNLKHSLSDPDFDPRGEDHIEVPSVPVVKADLFAVEDNINIKVLTPAAQICKQDLGLEDNTVEFLDPFDTSSVDQNILPGKTELKLIENEFLTAKTPETVTGVLDTLTDAQELGLGDKVLTPQAPPVVGEASIDDVDPFDTSFAENLRPGKAEIKVLETELIQN